MTDKEMKLIVKAAIKFARSLPSSIGKEIDLHDALGKRGTKNLGDLVEAINKAQDAEV